MKVKKNLLLPLAIAAGICSAVAAPTYYSVYFQNYSNGHLYKASDYSNDIPYALSSHNAIFGNGNSKYKIVKEPSNSNYKRLRLEFEEDTYGSSHVVTGSIVADRNNYTMEYKLRFGSNWDFARGGKLPGLAGGVRPAGGNPSRDGMSARLMWRDDNEFDGNYSGPKKTYIEMYHYWLGQAIAYEGGDNLRKTGDRTYMQDVSNSTWYTLKIRVNRGSSSSDGRLRCWINGVKKYDHNHRYLESGANWKLNAAWLHFFYGGNDGSWAPSRDTHLFFDNLKVDNDWF